MDFTIAVMGFVGFLFGLGSTIVMAVRGHHLRDSSRRIGLTLIFLVNMTGIDWIDAVRDPVMFLLLALIFFPLFCVGGFFVGRLPAKFIWAVREE